MQKAKQPKRQAPESPIPRNWLEIIKDDHCKPVVPVGPHFQADIPDWTGPSCSESNALKWLGTKVWPIEDGIPDTECYTIGKGRPDFCMCVSPGSRECRKRHISEKRVQLQFDLGPAFWNWKFEEMGEDVSKLWNLEEQNKFAYIVRMNPISQGKSFLEPASKAFPSQDKKDIVSYYFNVYIPRRMSIRTRSGSKTVNTDDEDDLAHCSGGPQKRSSEWMRPLRTA